MLQYEMYASEFETGKEWKSKREILVESYRGISGPKIIKNLYRKLFHTISRHNN